MIEDSSARNIRVLETEIDTVEMQLRETTSKLDPKATELRKQRHRCVIS
jgi:hypothetical protein